MADFLAAQMEENDSSSDDELSSDEELQLDFAQGRLKPGLIGRAVPKRTYSNNLTGLREKLGALRERPNLDWLERMDLVSSLATVEIDKRSGKKKKPEKKDDEEEEEKEGAVDPGDDFRREMHFYHQAQLSATEGLKKLDGMGVPTQRPEDYFAEMVKTDDHMRRVRENLLTRQKLLEQKEKARKLRELKKYGKKVQHEILQKRREEKKAALEDIKKFRKGRAGKPGYLTRDDDEDFPVAVSGKQGERKERGKGGQKVKRSTKREIKDQKFGFGGRKHWQKSNTADSSADMSTFSSGKPRGAQFLGKKGGRGRGGRGGGGGGVKRKGIGKRKGGPQKAKRLGKSRRQQMKSKQRT